MNCCWIILLLLFCGQNGNGFFDWNGNNGCGRDRNDGCGRDRNDGCDDNDGRSGGCGDNDSRSGRGCDEQVRPCPCEDSRFEPRFEQRPFNGNGSTCGCEAEGN